MARVLLSLLLALLLSNPVLGRVPPALQPTSATSSNDVCGVCKVAVHIVSDMMCDPDLDDAVVDWVVTNVCPQLGAEQQQCADFVRGLAPALVEWLRVNADPSVMCRDAGVCAAPSLLQHPSAPAHPHVVASRPNDVTCPLCMYVAARIKEQLGNPVTQADIHDASVAACNELPAGVMRDACDAFVEQYEMTFVKYIGALEPQDVCIMIGTCLDAALAAAGRAEPLRPRVVAAAMPLVAALSTPRRSAANNDHCETCKVVVNEMHQLVANPELQVQATDYAKQACGLVPSLADSCRADVDQYAPMLFGMVLAYLQPQQVCVQLKLCPPPSLQAAALAAQHATLAARYANWAAAKFQATSKIMHA